MTTTKILVFVVVFLVIVAFATGTCCYVLRERLKTSDISNDELDPALSWEYVENLKKAQKKMTRMLDIFHQICLRHGIRYAIAYGTLLGQVRHGGWIPWDGDIDVLISENDYKKFRQVRHELIPHGLWNQDQQDDDHYKSDLPKVRDIQSCYLDSGELYPWHNGLQIDLFVYNENNGNINVIVNSFSLVLQNDLVEPVQEVDFDGIRVYAPRNPRGVLDIIYPTWEKPVDLSKRKPHESPVLGLDAHNACPEDLKRYEKAYATDFRNL